MRTFIGLCFVLCALGVRAQDVTVTKAAPKIERKVFDPEHLPDPAPPLHEHEIAACEYLFKIDVSVQFLPGTAEPAPGGGFRAGIRVHRVGIKLAMPVTLWLPKGVDDWVKAHEEGHRAISEMFYKEADKKARALANQMIGKGYEGEGADKQSAYQAALIKASQDLCEKYMAQTGDPCKKVQAIYDDLTDHSKNKDITSDKAIAAAMEKYQAELKDAAKDKGAPK